MMCHLGRPCRTMTAGGWIRGQGDQGWVLDPSQKFLDAKMKWPKTEEFFDFELSTPHNHGISRPSAVCRD